MPNLPVHGLGGNAKLGITQGTLIKKVERTVFTGNMPEVEAVCMTPDAVYMIWGEVGTSGNRESSLIKLNRATLAEIKRVKLPKAIGRCLSVYQGKVLVTVRNYSACYVYNESDLALFKTLDFSASPYFTTVYAFSLDAATETLYVVLKNGVVKLNGTFDIASYKFLETTIQDYPLESTGHTSSNFPIYNGFLYGLKKYDLTTGTSVSVGGSLISASDRRLYKNKYLIIASEKTEFNNQNSWELTVRVVDIDTNTLIPIDRIPNPPQTYIKFYRDRVVRYAYESVIQQSGFYHCLDYQGYSFLFNDFRKFKEGNHFSFTRMDTFLLDNVSAYSWDGLEVFVATKTGYRILELK